MIVALKFHARLDLAPIFGRALAARAHALGPMPDAVVLPVPLAFERQVERGFNQAQELAQVIALALGQPLARNLLLRTRHGVAQQTLTLAERQRNVRGVFALRRPLTAGQVWLVDDVLTSGATLNEIAAVLKRAGVQRVINLVVARTP
jgi:ComF family protein